MGAIASGGIQVLNEDVLSWLHISNQAIENVAARELRELQRRDHLYRGNRPQPDLRNRTVIVVDDGLATGSTARAAIAVIQEQQPQRIVVAIPVAPPDICEQLSQEVDEVICVMEQKVLYSIGYWYENFAQISDEEVRALLTRAAHLQPVNSSS